MRGRGSAGTVCIVLVGLVAMLLTSCSSGSSHSATTKNKTGSSVQAAPLDAWQRTLRQAKPDGQVSVATALSAFAMAIGPVPGASVPQGPRPASLGSGTVAVNWVFQHWSELSPAQRQAVFKDLGARPVNTAELASYVHLAKTPTPPEIECPSASSSDAGPYLSHIPEITADLSSHLGAAMHLKIYITVNHLTKKAPGADGIMYTYGCSGGTTASGAVDSCAIHINPIAAAYTESDQTSFLIHEMEHCFVFNAVGGVAYDFHAWYEEGSATWAEVMLGGGDEVATDAWQEYLAVATRPLFGREYDGVGFFVHLAESGVDVWHRLLPMAKALGSTGTADGAAWNAADVSTNFLDSWGSGYVQGDYPGKAWTSGGGTGFPHQSADLIYKTLGDSQTLVVSAGSDATAADMVKVGAQVVSIAGSANGRMSLGGGEDVTLENRKNPYCTMGTACVCPAGSVNEKTVFSRMDPGIEYIGATNGLGAVQVTLTGMSLKDYCEKPCIVGTWKVTNEVVSLENASGGAGATWEIRPNGTAVIIHDGSDPLINHDIGFSIKYAGTETESWKIVGKSGPTSGTWDVVVLTGGVRATTNIGGVVRTRNIGSAPGYEASGSWSCHGDVMTASYAGVGESVTLRTRRPLDATRLRQHLCPAGGAPTGARRRPADKAICCVCGMFFEAGPGLWRLLPRRS